jgi:chromosome segregation ATPase
MTNLTLTAPYLEAVNRPEAANVPKPMAEGAPIVARLVADPAAPLSRQELLTTTALAKRNDELLAEQDRLYCELQDLRAYINGRHATWLELHAELVKYRDALSGMDRMVQARDATIARQDEEKRQFDIKMIRLERLYTEGAARRKSADIDPAVQQKLATLSEQNRRLEADLAKLGQALEQASKATADRQRQIAALENDIKRRDESIGTLRAQLEHATGDVAEAAATKDALRKRVDELEKEFKRSSEQTQTHGEDLRKVRDQLSLAQQQLADRAAQLAASEQAFAQRDALRKRVDELETELTRSSEQTGKVHEELRSTREQLQLAQQQLADRAAQLAASERASGQKGALRKRVDELEQELERSSDEAEKHRDELRSIRDQLQLAQQQLEDRAAQLAASQRALDQMDGLRQRIDELEKELMQRTEQTQAHDEDLRRLQSELQVAQQQLADRAAQQAASQQALDQKSRHAVQLETELQAAVQDAANVRADLANLAAHSAEIGRLHGEARGEIERLNRELERMNQELAAPQKNVATLEAELRSKQATVTMLEQSVQRITQLVQGSRAQRSLQPAPSPDQSGAVTPDDRHAAPKPRPPQVDDECRVMPRAVPHAEAGNSDAPGIAEVSRKLIVIAGGESAEYPLTMNHMTIGRGRGSDIRIEDHFVSRVHATIVTTANKTIIEDAGSRNGVFVNGERTARSVLRHGDVVALGGELKLRFVDAAH